MRLGRIVGAAAVLAACLVPVGCGGGEHSERHAAERTTPAPAPPTPDTTPIEPLRTPAGMVLKINEPTAPPAAQTAAPTAVPTPAPPTPAASTGSST
jgi:hypothetical protein